MLTPHFAVYVGKETETGFTGFISDMDIFLVIKVDDGVEREVGERALKIINEEVLNASIERLVDFDSVLTDVIKNLNFPLHFSLAAGLVKDNHLFLKTNGSGNILIKRQNELLSIISGDNIASGTYLSDDMYIFTTQEMIQQFGNIENMKKTLGDTPFTELQNALSSYLTHKDENLISLCVAFEQETVIQSPENQNNVVMSEEQPVVEEVEMHSKTIKPNFKTILSNLRDRKSPLGKKVTIAVVLLIAIILVWSVGLGYQRRQSAQMDQRILATREDIQHKLSQAEEASFLNPQSAAQYIAEATNEYEVLRNDLKGKNKDKQLQDLQSFITDKEAKIMKKEEVKYTEYYDLALDTKNAQGVTLNRYNETLIILDSTNSSVYFLSLPKKSLQKKTAAELKGAQLIALYENTVFFYDPNNGIFTLTDTGSVKKVIEKDSEWGNIMSMSIYGGNIYLLDSQKNDIYKYLVAENGYSTKNSYLKGYQLDLSASNSLSIDSSIYIGLKDTVYKFTAGAKDEFETKFPNENVDLAKIITDKDIGKVYAWDKNGGTLYVLGKNGSYERQIISSVLKTSTDVTVFGNKSYVVSGSKIYEIPLE